jgi:hypothetical protein
MRRMRKLRRKRRPKRRRRNWTGRIDAPDGGAVCDGEETSAERKKKRKKRKNWKRQQIKNERRTGHGLIGQQKE